MGRLRGYGWLWWMVRFVNFHEKISGKKSVTPHWTMAVTINREGRKPCFSSQTLFNFLGAKKCWLSPGKNTVKSWLLIWSICICCSWPTPSFGFKQAELDSKLRSKHPRSGNIFGTPRWRGTSQQIRPPPYRNWKPAVLFMCHLPCLERIGKVHLWYACTSQVVKPI